MVHPQPQTLSNQIVIKFVIGRLQCKEDWNNADTMYKNSQSNRIDISNLSFVIFSAFSQASGQIRDISVKWLDDSDGQLTARYDDDSAWDKIHNQEQENEENLPNSTRAPVQGVEIIGAGDQRHAP